jgi:hypothetical protein
MYNFNYTYDIVKKKSPVQLPLHEPYFDFTLIRVAHRKNPIKKSNLLHYLL